MVCLSILVLTAAVGGDFKIEVSEDAPVVLPKNEAEVTQLLERRWSIKEIEKHCVAKNRFPNTLQNLVTDGDVVWRGKLYAKNLGTFDDIHWYANVSRESFEYSLNARRGKDNWLLELGNAESLRQTRKAKK